MNYKVSYKRHLGKTISYRILSTTLGFLTMWSVTGSLKIGATFSIVELVYKPIQYYIHERIWYKYIKFGLLKETLKIEPDVIKEKQEIKEILQPEKKILNYSSNR